MNWKAYEEGFEAWGKYYRSGWKKRDINPYKKDTDKWRGWNRGWNTNQVGLDDTIQKQIDL